MKKHTFKPNKKFDREGPSNETRAGWGEVGLMGFLCATGEPQTTGEDEISDLIADLAHLCDRDGMDFEALVTRARMNWQAER